VRGPIGVFALVSFVLAAAVACTPSRSGSPASPTTTAAAAHHATNTTAAPAPGKASPKQLRGQFEQLLGQHTLLAVRQMRSVVAAKPDFRQAADASLRQNSDALSQLVTSAYGGTHGARFKPLWQRHVIDLSAYANAVASQDASAKQKSRAALMADSDAYGSWVAEASKGRVRASDAAAGVRMHVEELMQQLDAYAARDYDQAYKIEREAFEHMFTAGTTLAKASITPELAIGIDAPPEKLRSAFAMLLGEHMELMVDAQRATFAGSPEFKAAAAQVNANTTTLTQAMGAIVGPKKAAEFQTVWANHVEGLVAYSTAVATKDEAAKATAKGRLDRFASMLALYLSDSVQNKLAAGLLTNAITNHDTHLIDQIDAYAANDYTKAHQIQLEGYQQMLGVSNLLVNAIQKTMQPRLPAGGPKTGGGGTAQPRR
jgi:hypothetical protein